MSGVLLGTEKIAMDHGRGGGATTSGVCKGGVMPRIALIHALPHSRAPIEAAFAEYWPAVHLTNLLDDSLATDLAAAGALDAGMAERFLMLGRYAGSLGCNAILFTCSAFGPCIAAVRGELAPLPVHGPNDAMIAKIAAIGGRVALVATFAPTLQTMPAEFPSNVEIEAIYVADALSALSAGDLEGHDRRVVEALRHNRCDAVALAQYSLARVAPMVSAVVNAPVLTGPATAVRELRRALLAGEPKRFD
jgi:Asp/Glu/hydantoin racemase